MKLRICPEQDPIAGPTVELKLVNRGHSLDVDISSINGRPFPIGKTLISFYSDGTFRRGECVRREMGFKVDEIGRIEER